MSLKKNYRLRPVHPMQRPNETTGYLVLCPGCQRSHFLRIKPEHNKPVWSFNGDMDKPTFEPSVLSRVEWPDRSEKICHFFLRDGIFDFLGDCTHSKAGQKVAMPV